MSSVEGSDRGEDSLSDQLQLVLKSNKLQRNKHNSRGSRNANSQDSLYKEALKEYMFGRFDMASESCKKMIASNPENPEPYFLMATMYQQAATKNHDENELYKSIQYFFFHAYYSQPSVEKWLKVADMSYNMELYQQAAYCYGRALKMDKTNLQICLKRAECLQMCLQIKKAANIYKRIIQKYSNSAQVFKRYAKLRFRREQYSKARQILLSYPQYSKDQNIKFMIAQTYQRQHKFPQLYNFIQENVIKNAEPPITDIYEELQLQFLQMLFICRVNCPEQTAGKGQGEIQVKVQEMLEYFIREYQRDQWELYDQIIGYIEKENPEVTFKLLSFLIKFQPHQRIENYLYCSEYLMKSGHCQQAIKILQSGLQTQKNKNSIQLKTQLNYLKTLLKNKNKNQNPSERKPASKTKFMKSEEEEIFYSDEEEGHSGMKEEQNQDSYNYQFRKKEEDSLFQEEEEEGRGKRNGKQKKIEKKRVRKPQVRVVNRIEVKDPDIVSKLITNNQLTLSALQSQIEGIRANNDEQSVHLAIHRNFSQVKQCLEHLVQIQGTVEQRKEAPKVPVKNSQSIFNNRQPKKRRMIIGHNIRRHNVISRNSASLIQSLKSTIYFMKQYLKIKKYGEVIDFAQLLSKAHFFKWQNRRIEFRELKREVYEIGLLACLELKKYGKSIFFLRYLINKNPLNEFYLAIAQKIMRLSAGKLFINKMIRKGIDAQFPSPEATEAADPTRSQKDLVKIYYMTGLEYMQNCFFELALNMFVKVLKIIEEGEPTGQQREMCRMTYMCMSTCFLQMASSRTMFNKLDQINRSAYCLARYKSYCEEGQQTEMDYNQARWYSYTKLFSKALPLYQKLLEQQSSPEMVQKSALNSMIIYREIGDYEKVRELSQKYFGEAGN